MSRARVARSTGSDQVTTRASSGAPPAARRFSPDAIALGTGAILYIMSSSNAPIAACLGQSPFREPSAELTGLLALGRCNVLGQQANVRVVGAVANNHRQLNALIVVNLHVTGEAGLGASAGGKGAFLDRCSSIQTHSRTFRTPFLQPHRGFVGLLTVAAVDYRVPCGGTFR